MSRDDDDDDDYEDPTFDAFLDEVDALAEDDPEAALAMLTDVDETWEDYAELHYLRGDVVWRIQGAEAAEKHLQQAVELDPEFADARHALALVYEELGDREAMIAQFLAVHRLDARDDIGAGIGTPDDQRFIAGVAEAVLEDIPEEFSERIGNVPVVLEPRPPRHMVEDGFDPRALGVFEGPDQFEAIEAKGPATARIVLFYSNLLASFPEEDDLREQIEVTILHEIGHYFGLDEDDMERLGLE